MHNRERLSSEQLNQMKRAILHDFNPVTSDKEELIAFWESLSICEKDSILMVYDLAVIDDLIELLALLPELTLSSQQSHYPSVINPNPIKQPPLSFYPTQTNIFSPTMTYNTTNQHQLPPFSPPSHKYLHNINHRTHQLNHHNQQERKENKKVQQYLFDKFVQSHQGNSSSSRNNSRSQKKSSSQNVSHCEQIIKMPEKQILLEFLYLDGLEDLLRSNTTATSTSPPMRPSYFNQMCVIVNRISNEAQFQSLLSMHTVKDCSDLGLVSGKKKVLKFKSSALFSIFDALDETVDSFCLGEKVLLRKRHYAALYSQLVRKHSPPQTDINDTISSILQFLGIVFENNLIKAYLKTNRFSSTKNPIRDIPVTLPVIGVTSSSVHTTTITTSTTVALTETTNSTPSTTTTTPNTIESPHQKQSIDSHSDLAPQEVSLLEGIHLDTQQQQQSQDQQESHSSLVTAPLLVESVSANIEQTQSGFEPISKFFAGSSTPQPQSKRKILTYCESEVEYMFSYYYCLVNTSSLLIKVDLEDEIEKVDSDEEYYTQDEKENFHFNQDLLDYDIADVLGDSFKFEPSLCLSKDQIKILKDQMQQQHQQYSSTSSSSLSQHGQLPSSQTSQSSSSSSQQQLQQQQQQQSQQQSQASSSANSKQQFSSNSTSNSNGSKHNRESKQQQQQSEHSEQSNSKSQHQRMMTDLFGQAAAGMLPDFSSQFNPQNPLYFMFMMNQQMMMNSQQNYSNGSAGSNMSRSGGNNSLGNSLHSKYSKNSNHSHKQSGGQRDHGSGQNSNPFSVHSYDAMSNQFQQSQQQQSSSSSQQQSQSSSSSRNKGGKQQSQQSQQSSSSGQSSSNQGSRGKKSGGNPSNSRQKKFSQAVNPEDDSRNTNNSGNNGNGGNQKRAVGTTGNSSSNSDQQYQRSSASSSSNNNNLTESGSGHTTTANTNASGSRGKQSQSNNNNSNNNKSKKSNSNKNYDPNASSSMGQLSFLPQSSQVSNSNNSFSQSQHHSFSLVPITGNQLRRSKE